jgi:nucleotidyltransferase substrate binding protein (TIGR01987 family)
MSGKLDLSSFEAAVKQLGGMYAFALSPDVKNDPVHFDYMRTAVIKGFEYSYSLAIKVMTRFLAVYNPNFSEEDPEKLRFRDLLREVWEYKLITSQDAWIIYREKRNIANHGYEVSKANEIFEIIPDFLNAVQHMLNVVKKFQRDTP